MVMHRTSPVDHQQWQAFLAALWQHLDSASVSDSATLPEPVDTEMECGIENSLPFRGGSVESGVENTPPCLADIDTEMECGIETTLPFHRGFVERGVENTPPCQVELEPIRDLSPDMDICEVPTPNFAAAGTVIPAADLRAQSFLEPRDAKRSPSPDEVRPQPKSYRARY
jgi:hypothetical protein